MRMQDPHPVLSKTTARAFVGSALTVLCVGAAHAENLSEGTYLPRYDPGPACNESLPIVRESDPATVSHRLKIGHVTIGYSDTGGGYINYCDIGNTDGKDVNVNAPDYGKGWQGAIRDQIHSGRYNPTQGGFRDPYGAPVAI
jgi:hypothetical protein